MRNSQNSVTTTITTTKPDNLILKWAKSLHSHFYKDTQMNNIHGNVLSITIREMQINTTMRYHFIPVRMAFIKADRKWQRCLGCGEIGALRPCQWQCEMIQSLCKSLVGPQKVKHRMIA